MPRMGRQLTIRATSVGKGLPRLDEPRTDWGRVAAVFRRSCHVLDDDGKVACIVDRRLGNGPVNICVDLPDGLAVNDLGISPGARLRLAGENLHLDGVTLGLSGAERWTPPPVGPQASAAEVRRRVSTLGAALASFAPTEGLAPTASVAEHLAWSRSVEPGATHLVAAALPHVDGLMRGLLALDGPLVDASVGGLVGLGPGLTPSGDDLLAGLLLAMTVGEAGPAAKLLGDSASSLAVDRTTVLSATLLGHAAKGSGPEAAHTLLASILGESPQPDLQGAARSLTEAGHTSGWDTLAGLLLGIHLALRIRHAGRGRPLERSVAHAGGAG